MKIKYVNDGKCKHNSWEATLDGDDQGHYHEFWFVNLTGYGEHKQEAHDELIKKIQEMLQLVHKTMVEAVRPPDDTPEERAERHRARYGYW